MIVVARRLKVPAFVPRDKTRRPGSAGAIPLPGPPRAAGSLFNTRRPRTPVQLLGFDDVWKSYDEVRWVLQNVTLDLRPGTLTLIRGRSGSGKTTLLNLAAGLEIPSKGVVRIDGKDLAQLSEEERTALRLRRIGLVFQHYQLIPQLTVFENVRLPLRLAQRQDADVRTGKLLEEFGLAQHASSFPSTLSGGEAQRTGIARALGNEPGILLADEPTANLDEANGRAAMTLLQDAAKRFGAAVLVASHDDLVREYADHVFYMKDGRLEPAPATVRPGPPTPGPTAPPGASTQPAATPGPRSSASPAPLGTRLRGARSQEAP